jgi:hypothetical protein
LGTFLFDLNDALRSKLTSGTDSMSEFLFSSEFVVIVATAEFGHNILRLVGFLVPTACFGAFILADVLWYPF